MIQSLPADAQTTPIRYTLRFPAPQTHMVEVSAEVPAGQPAVELLMAVWTPGSYMVREYSRNVEAVRATAPDGRVLSVRKSDKNRWRVETGGVPSFTLAYRVYGREMTVRNNWIDSSVAFLNGAPTYLTLADGRVRPHEVTIVPPAGWARVVTALDQLEGAPHRFVAPDFDTLVDSPILAGNPTVVTFEVDGRPIALATHGDAGQFDHVRAAKDLEKIVREHAKLWGGLPFRKYVFLNILTLPPGQGGGGLEHGSSVAMMDSKFASRARQSYVSWLELASHEFFHAWNIKRLRPVELGPFNYERENLTRSLWIAEGITDYYGELLVRRAGLSTPDEYLVTLSNKIEDLQGMPGRLVMSVEQASFDAWIRYYRPDENSPNVAISYYTKGAVLGFLLDARIRTVTRGAKSLDDVMRAAYARYSGAKGYTPDEFRAVAEEVAGTSLRSFWAAYVEAPGEIDYNEALETFGVRFRQPDGAGRAWLGVSTRNDAGRLLVTQVRRGTPAYDAGLNVDDEILAVDEVRVRADRWDGRLAQQVPGDVVTLLVARRDELVRITATLGTDPGRWFRLELQPTLSDAQRATMAHWMGV